MDEASAPDSVPLLRDRSAAADKADGLERAATLAKVQAETEKLQREAEKLQAERSRYEREIASFARQERFEGIRLWIPLLAPMLTTFVLAGTLLFQIVQFKATIALQTASTKESQEYQERTTEDAAWREALKTLAEAQTTEARVAGLALFKGFLNSRRYSRSARDLQLQYLTRIWPPDVFNELFRSSIGDPGWTNLQEILRVNHNLATNFDALMDLHTSMKRARASGSSPEPARSREELDFVEENISFVASQLAAILRTEGRPPTLDLRRLSIWDADLRGANLRNADLEGSVLNRNKISRAKLSGITSFADTRWFDTSWWLADSIDPKLLEYLARKFPYQANRRYPEQVSGVEEYRSNLSRLASAGQ